jgi:hypothetical protein
MTRRALKPALLLYKGDLNGVSVLQQRNLAGVPPTRRRHIRHGAYANWFWPADLPDAKIFRDSGGNSFLYHRHRHLYNRFENLHYPTPDKQGNQQRIK